MSVLLDKHQLINFHGVPTETVKYDDHYLKYMTRTLLLLNPEPKKEWEKPHQGDIHQH